MTPDLHVTAESGTVPSTGKLRDGEHGSALIISMMIMVILTMLGVTFAVLAAQEERISVNSRDHQQTLYAAEAVVEIAKTWFNDPDTATNPMKPLSNQMRYELRKGRAYSGSWKNPDERAATDVFPTTDTDAGLDGSNGNIYTGGTLGGLSGESRFDKPFRGPTSVQLWGRQNTPDVLICKDATLDVDGLANIGGLADCQTVASGTDPMHTYVNRVNQLLASMSTGGHSTRDFGTIELEQVRVYRPPVDFTLNLRYGIATVEATAVKRVRNQIVSRRTVREVLQEVPFPGPSGAIESEGEISAAGSSGVHWGSVVSSATTDDISLPGKSGNFPDASVGRDSPYRFGYHHTINPAAFTNQGTQAGTIANWMTEALGITKSGQAQNTSDTGSPPSKTYAAGKVGDPWLLFRARRRIIVGGTPLPTSPQPYTFRANTDNSGTINNQSEFNKKSENNWSHMFQFQIVRFPPMDYQLWKDVAQSGQNGMNYFKWSAGTNYRRDGTGAAQTWTAWLNQYKTGVFFFDTTNSVRPADICKTAPNDATCNLTGTHAWTTNLYVEGFIYLNSKIFDSAGAGGGTTKECNMPGEVFLDDGIDLHTSSQTVGDDCLCIRYDETKGCTIGVRPIGWRDANFTCTGADGDDCQCAPNVLKNTDNGSSAADMAVAKREAETFRNGVWDSDLNNDGISDVSQTIVGTTPWNNFISNNNGANEGFTGGHGYAPGIVPGYPTPRRIRQGQENVTPTRKDWMRDSRFQNHFAAVSGWNATHGRQVHEPFLNFDSPATNTTPGTWANDHNLTVDFRSQDEPVARDSANVIVKRTTRSRDATGALMNLDLHINGVFYCEGQYTGTGNMKVYGSLLMRKGYAGTGSVDVWFNEGLIKGDFPPKAWKLPRVYASARDTN